VRGEHAGLHVDRADLLRPATVRAPPLVEDELAHLLLLDLIHRLADLRAGVVEVLELRRECLADAVEIILPGPSCRGT
jgi:hypothetical protein